MATQTQHFSLTKPDWEDRASISVLNANTDIIDAQMYDNEQSAANAIGNMAEEYDDTATYAVGDFCIYSEVLYKCVTAVTVAEAFDSTKWTQTTAAENFGSGGGGGSATLAGLNDVNLTSPTDGQALVYDAINQEWVNGAGGGGTGGHVIINENGASMTARAGLQFVGGANVSDDNVNNRTVVDLASAGGIDGVFIDTTNVIHTISDGNDSFKEWIATDDCYIIGTIKSSQSPAVQIDNITVAYIVSPSETLGVCVIAKKGQSVKYRMSAQSTLTAYGIQTGTTHSKFQPIIYSTEEREVGVWTDGKPLYEKTFLFNYNDLQNETYGKYINLSIPNIDKSCLFTISLEDGSLILPYYQGTNLYIVAFPALSTDVCKFSFRYGSEVSSQISAFFTDCKIILRYTKTTDTAGSGTWTPQGVPAVHYSTDEHVIGTWIDGKPLYERVIYVPYASLTNYGVLKGYNVRQSGEEPKDFSGSYAISTTYGICPIGARNYANASLTSDYFEFSMYYYIPVLARFTQNTWENIAPNLYIIYKYTKTTD